MEGEDPRLGTILQDRYRIVQRLAAGGMGVVYRGERLKLERAVAIKFLHATFAADTNQMKRFEREAMIMGRLAHPHCVSVIDVGLDSAPYIVMDYIGGRTLKDILDDGSLPPLRAIHIIRQVLAGLAHAHGLDIVHRDIKPANIIIADAAGTRDHVYVLDFGLARFRESAMTDDLTGSAALIGTPSYMSPEQARGEKAGVASDVYSTGVMLFELIAGFNPFKSDNALDTLLNHQKAPIPHLGDEVSHPDLPEGLDEVLTRAMAKDPKDRFSTALEFAEALDELGTRRRGAVVSSSMASPGGNGRRGDVAHAQDEPSAGESVSGSVVEVPSISRTGVAVLLVLLSSLSAVITWYMVRSDRQRDMEAVAAPLAIDAAPELEVVAVRSRSEHIDAKGKTAAPHAAIDAAVPAPANAPVDTALETPAAQLADAGAAPGESEQPDTGPVEPPVIRPESRPSNVRVVRDVVLLIQQGRREDAIAGIHKLLPSNNKSAYLPFLLGNLYFEKKWWGDGLAAYRDSIRKNSIYAKKPEVINNAILALSSDKTESLATSLILRSIGKAALPALRRAAQGHANTTVRKRAAALVKRLGG